MPLPLEQLPYRDQGHPQDNMAKKRTLTSLIVQQNVLAVLLLTLMVIMVWVGFTIYFSYSKTTVTTTDAALIAPLTPRLDSELFDQLAARKSWSEAELSNFQPVVVITTPTGTTTVATIEEPTPIATSSATPTSSPSGELQ